METISDAVAVLSARLKDTGVSERNVLSFQAKLLRLINTYLPAQGEIGE